MDIFDTEQEYIIEADLPDVLEADFDIAVSKDGQLTIKAARENKEEHKDRRYYQVERSYGSFERILSLPLNCDRDKVNASFKNGSLLIKIPKKSPVAGELKKILVNHKKS